MANDDHAVVTDEDRKAFAALRDKKNITIRDLDIDAFADGVIAHRNGVPFHENPDGHRPTVRGLSWTFGWNERALTGP